MKTEIFADANYNERMRAEVEPWWAEQVQRLRCQSYDGTKIQAYYALNPKADHAVVFVHGFTEYAEKFSELLYYFYNEGYSVFMMDQRGHGRSGRKIENPELVYAESFDEYIEDLRFFIDTVVREEVPELPLFLYGHSMGGCIASLFVERYPDTFRAAILSSPMLKISFGGMPDAAANLILKFSYLANWKGKPAPNAQPFNPEPDFENTCATSEVRYLYTLAQQREHRAYQTCGATYGWLRAAVLATKEALKNAAKAALPILICQAGNDTLVDNSAEEAFAAAAPNAALVRFPEAKHEIYRSPKATLEVYYDAVLGFLEKQK